MKKVCRISFIAIIFYAALFSCNPYNYSTPKKTRIITNIPIINSTNFPTSTITSMPTLTSTFAPTFTEIPTINLFITYHNCQYNFKFHLPESWVGYSIIKSQWFSCCSNKTSYGPQITIYHPETTIQKPIQDIPIVIFTHKQWNSIRKGEYYLSASGDVIELGHNDNYYFALPPNYDEDNSLLIDEVHRILYAKPLQIPC